MSDLPNVDVKLGVITAVAFIDYNNLVLNRRMSQVDGVVVTDNLTIVNAKGLLLADAVAPGDNSTQLVGADLAKALADSAAPSDVTAFGYGPGLSDSAAPTDAMSLATAKPLTDTFGVSDGLLIDHGISLADSATPSDSTVAAIPTTTWNPADKDASITLGSGNKVANSSTFGSPAKVRALTGRSSGRYYFAVSAGSGNVAQAMAVGVCLAGTSLTAHAGDASGEVALRDNNSTGNLVRSSGGNIDGTDLPYVNPTHTVGVAVDLNAGQIYFQIDGTWCTLGSTGGQQDPTTGANAIGGLSPSTVYYPAASFGVNGLSATLVSGTPPAGYAPWQ